MFNIFVLTVLMKPSVCQCQDDDSAVGVGGFFGGLAVGAVTVLLVVGIMCGVCKLRRHPKQLTSNKPPSK